MAGLEERLKKGDRWFLALVDPLLDKPVYFALRESEVSVGFHPIENDWQLPTHKMGLDVVGDSYRLGSDEKTAAPHRKFLKWPWREGFPEQAGGKAPFFHVYFNATPDGLKCWSVHCECDSDVGSCSVEPVGRGHKAHALWSEDTDNDARYPDMNPETDVSELRDGDVFEFVWPYWQYDYVRKDSIFELPPQRLSFVFIEELAKAKGTNELLEVGTTVQGPKRGKVNLMSLPRSVLAQIASYFEPQEFMRTLGLVSRVFFSPAMKGTIPWKTLKLDNSFDAYRVPEMADPEAVRHVKCYKPWSISQRSGIYLKWKPLIIQDSVVSLEVRDHQLLCTMGVPPNLKELSIVIEDDVKVFVQSLQWVPFPSTIEKLSIAYRTDRDQDVFDDSSDDDELRSLSGHGWSSEDESADEMRVGSRRKDKKAPEDFEMDQRWLFNTFDSLEKLQLEDVPMTKQYWQMVPQWQLANINHLAIKGMDGVPLARFKSLVRLELDLYYEEIISSTRSVCWNRLENLVLYNRRGSGRDEGDAELLRVLEKMPNLVALQMAGCRMKFPADTFVRLSLLLPHLRFVDFDYLTVSLAVLADVITNNPKLDVVKIAAATGLIQGVDREAFPTGSEGSVEWRVKYEPRGRPESCDYSFLYSRVSSRAREALMSKYRSALVDRNDRD